MKESIAPAIKELERFFNFFNRKLYDNKLPTPIITIQSTGRKNALGWFWADAWKRKKGDVPEINITAEHLNRGVSDVLETLLHEMVHLDNWHQKIPDCSAAQYHNAAFKRGCEKIELICERGKHGWNLTSLSGSLSNLIKQGKPNAEAFAIFRRAELGARKGVGSRLKKWSCGCTNIRVAVSDFSATCNNCGNEFEEME